MNIRRVTTAGLQALVTVVVLTIAAVWIAYRTDRSVDMPFFGIMAIIVPITLGRARDLSRVERVLIASVLSLLLILVAFLLAVAIDPRLAFSWRGLVGAATLGTVVALVTSLLTATLGHAGRDPVA